MTAYRFFAEGTPAPQPRTRIGRTKSGKGISFDPGTSNGWKDMVAMAARSVRPAAPLAGPLSFSAEFIFPRPQSHYSKAGGLKPGAPEFVSSKGRCDLDNLMKAPADMLTRMGFWEDDGQLASATLLKRYVLAGERPGAWFEIQEIGARRSG
jgi:Holliday junction resolvase RusA-like endonuclease